MRFCVYAFKKNAISEISENKIQKRRRFQHIFFFIYLLFAVCCLFRTNFFILLWFTFNWTFCYVVLCFQPPFLLAARTKLANCMTLVDCGVWFIKTSTLRHRKNHILTESWESHLSTHITIIIIILHLDLSVHHITTIIFFHFFCCSDWD